MLVDPGIVERYAKIPWVRGRAIGNVTSMERSRVRQFGQRSPEMAYAILYPSRVVGLNHSKNGAVQVMMSHGAARMLVSSVSTSTDWYAHSSGWFAKRNPHLSGRGVDQGEGL